MLILISIFRRARQREARNARGRRGTKQTLTTLACPPHFHEMLRSGILAASVLLIGGCSDACSNSEIARATAPDGLHSAVMFQRACGATTSPSTQVSVVEQGQDAAGGGNGFRADDDHGAAVDGAGGGPWAEMRWLAPDHLLIRYAAKSRVFAQEDEVSGVKISYQQVTR